MEHIDIVRERVRNHQRVFEVRISRKEEDHKFRVRIDQVILMNGDPHKELPLNAVMVGERDEVYCPRAANKTYSVYVLAPDMRASRDKGVGLIKAYRKDVEGIE